MSKKAYPGEKTDELTNMAFFSCSSMLIFLPPSKLKGQKKNRESLVIPSFSGVSQ